jgi:predicted amidohydrolase
MFRVSAIQLAFSLAATPQHFFDRVCEPIERAVASTDAHTSTTARYGAQLVALPNYTWMMLLRVAIPTTPETFSLGEIARGGGYATVAEMLHVVAPTIHDFYFHVCAAIAERAQVYLAPGSVLECVDDKLYNTAYLFGPDGKLIGAQRQTHRTPREIAWGIAPGDALNVFDIGSARVGFVLGADVGYPEVSRILALQNANLLIHQAAYPGWHGEHFLTDLWREVQANQVFGLQVCAVGKEFKGKSAVYAPVEMTDKHRGILAQASRRDRESIVSGSLDFDALQKVIDSYPIFDFFNYDFYAREFPGVYRSASNTQHAPRTT